MTDKILTQKKHSLEVAEITEANYQLYSPAMAQQTKRIIQLQEKRFTLEEIRDKLAS
ncbi:MAG: MerR family transcriptional regulator [Verrucomicrobiota bacterium]